MALGGSPCALGEAMIVLAYILAILVAPLVASLVLVLFMFLPLNTLPVRLARGFAFGVCTVAVGWSVFRLLHQSFGIGAVAMLLAACMVNDYRRVGKVEDRLRKLRLADLWADALGIGIAGCVLLI